MRLAIVIVLYNRIDSAKRLLESIKRITNVIDNVDLILSIDKSDKEEEMILLTDNLTWKYGKIYIRTFPENQGLKKHILKCGEYTTEYDGVIILEDDLIVSPYIVQFATDALNYYGDMEEIAGISLYKHRIVPGINRIFETDTNSSDVFLLQYAQSWGQCWNKRMWDDFYQWYVKNENYNFDKNDKLPEYLGKWGKNSWLKYHIAYVVENNKYFLYPNISLTTNCTEAGVHSRSTQNDYQVPFLINFRSFNMLGIDKLIKYDVYFERVDLSLKSLLNINGKVCLNLYGARQKFDNYDYMISCDNFCYEIERRFRLKLRPIELNLIYQEEGNDIFVYNLNKKNNKMSKNGNINVYKYDLRTITWRKCVAILLYEIKNKITSKINCL